MKKIILFLLPLVFVLTSCGKKTDEKNNGGAFNGSRNDIIVQMGEQILNVVIPGGPEWYAVFADFSKSFTKIYPNITVEFIRQDGYYSLGNYFKRDEDLRGEYEYAVYGMLSGSDPPDMFMAPRTYLPYSDFFYEYLADFYQIIYGDNLFDPADYFMNAVDAYSAGGKLFEFPINFNFRYIAVNASMPQSLTDEFEKKDFADWFWLLDIYDSGYGTLDGRYWNVYPGFFYDDAVAYTASAFLDYIEGSGRLDDIAYNELLLRAMLEPELTEAWQSLSGATPRDEKLLRENYMFAKLAHDAWQFLFPAETGGGHEFIHPVPFADEHGRLLLLQDRYSVNFCISEQSQKKELAWEFIKHTMTPEANGYGEIYRELPHIKPLLTGGSIYKPTYMAVYDRQIKSRLEKLAADPYNMKYAGDTESLRAVIEKQMDQISSMTARVIPFYASVNKKIYAFKTRGSSEDEPTGGLPFLIYAELASMYGKERLLPFWPLPAGFTFNFELWALESVN